MEVGKHNPGTFCWMELGTSDQSSAKRFYSELFGWSINDVPMGPESFYTMLQLNGKEAAALYQLNKDQLAQGVPPHWLVYISTEDVDKSVNDIKAGGGKILMGPIDVFTEGRMAVAQDPTGATFAVWQPLNHIGIKIIAENNSFCWAELATTDTAVAKEFYVKVFGWKAEGKDFGPVAYTEFYLGEQAIGGMMKLAPEMGDAPPHWMIYFSVADCDAVAEKAKSLGGKICSPPGDIPNVGRFSVIQDPQGAAFSIITLSNAG